MQNNIYYIYLYILTQRITFNITLYTHRAHMVEILKYFSWVEHLVYHVLHTQKNRTFWYMKYICLLSTVVRTEQTHFFQNFAYNN